MKKIISLILCITLITLVLVSCGDEVHVHQYNRNEWAYDATNHWYAATCECTDAGTKNLGKHVDTMNDGYCDICGYLTCNNTAYSDVLNYNENTHWYDPSCGHNGQNSHILSKDFSEHDFDDAGLCTFCGYQCAKTDYNESWSSDDTDHWYAPSCGHYGHLPAKDKAPHVDLDENEAGEVKGDGVCDVCSKVSCAVPDKKADEAAYNAFYETTYSHDDTYHWYAPVCGHVGHELKDRVIHTDENGDGSCDGCFVVMPEPSEE